MMLSSMRGASCLAGAVVMILMVATFMVADAHKLGPTHLTTATPGMLRIIDRWSAAGKQQQQGAAPTTTTMTTEKYCPLCELVLGDLVKIVENRTKDQQLLADLDRKCDSWFPKNDTVDEILKDLCHTAAHFLIVKGLGYFEGDIEHKDWHDVPQIFCSWVHMCSVDCCLSPTAPEQIHLSFADSTRGFEALRVTWTTQNVVPGSSVQWWTTSSGGPDDADDSQIITKTASSNSSTVVVPAQSRTYTDGGWVGMIYSAVMETLPLNSSFTYRVGSSATSWSNNFTVRTAPKNVGQPGGRPLRVAQVADMGTNEPNMGSPSNGTIDHLTLLAQSGEVDFILHVGDISYADGNQHRWDRFMRVLEPVAAYVPYMTAPGNHECQFNFASYRNRFWMPEITPYIPIKKDLFFWNLGYYDFKVGGTNFVMLDAEAPFGGTAMTDNQLQWASLSMQNAAKNRALNATPWTVAAHHRPLYCTNLARDCGPNFAGQMQGWIEEIRVW